MYASSCGGGVTPIEIREIPTEKKLTLELTGLQGEMMIESMKVARTVAWEYIPDTIKHTLQLQWKEYGNTGYHIKYTFDFNAQGWSKCWSAITACIISYITKQKIRKDIAVTGEIDLNGNAREIRGLDQKIIWSKKGRY